jgi:hypothetical protein
MREQKTSDEPIFDKIESSEALQILKTLAQGDPNIRQRIEEIFLNQVQEVDVAEISDTVFSDLDFLEVEELWDRSGSHRDGYTDSVEAAWEMIEEVIEPHRENMQRLHALGMFREEMCYCMGVISGLYRFESESATEFRNWAEDISGELASQILTEWTESCRCPKMLAEMKQFEAAGHK